MTFPAGSLSEMIVLLNEALTCAAPRGTTRFSRRRRGAAFGSAPCASASGFSACFTGGSPRGGRAGFRSPASALPLGLCHRLLPPGHCLARAAARARVRARALAADRQVPPVAKTAVAADLLKPLDVQRDLSAKITLDREAAIDDLADLRDLRLGAVAYPRARVHARLLEDLARSRG